MRSLHSGASEVSHPQLQGQALFYHGEVPIAGEEPDSAEHAVSRDREVCEGSRDFFFPEREGEIGGLGKNSKSIDKTPRPLEAQ